MKRKTCTSCEEEFSTDQAIELKDVSEEFAERVFEKLMDEKMCAECIITIEAMNETMKEDTRNFY